MRDRPLNEDFFTRDALVVARELIGTRLVLERTDRPRLVARVVETEAYKQFDAACHAFTVAKKPNPNRRGAALFGRPGDAYVYFNYGVHWMLNVIAEPIGSAAAVLIRAVEPLEGIDEMRQRRGVTKAEDIGSGPGKLTAAFGIDARHHLTDLTQPPLYFTAAVGEPLEVATSPRIGITKAADLPWRFFAVGNRHVSRGKTAIATRRKRKSEP